LTEVLVYFPSEKREEGWRIIKDLRIVHRQSAREVFDSTLEQEGQPIRGWPSGFSAGEKVDAIFPKIHGLRDSRTTQPAPKNGLNERRVLNRIRRHEPLEPIDPVYYCHLPL
jgi:hypothetical protein